MLDLLEPRTTVAELTKRGREAIARAAGTAGNRAGKSAVHAEETLGGGAAEDFIPRDLTKNVW